MSRAEGGHALPGTPSLWSGVRWRRRRAWRQRRSTSGSSERSRAPTRPASGPRSGTLGTGATDGRAWAGPGGRLPRGCAPGRPPAGPAPAPPFGEPGERPPPSARRVPLRSPAVGSLPDRRRRQPRYSVGSSCLPRGWGSRRSPSEARPARARQVVAFSRASP